MQKPLPIVTMALLFANLVAAAFFLGDSSAARIYGLIPHPLGTDIGPTMLVRVFSCMFLHVEPVHILGNLVFLAAVGPAVEEATGWLKFLVVYLAGGVIAVFAHYFMVIAAQPLAVSEPLLGASSPIAALIGFYCLRFYRRSVPVLPKVKVPVFVLIAIWLVLQIIGGIMANLHFQAPIAYWSHIAGVLAGFGFAFVFGADKAARKEAWADRFVEAKGRGPAAQAANARQYLRKHPSDCLALKSLAEALIMLDDSGHALEPLAKILKLKPSFDGGYSINRLDALGLLGEISCADRVAAARKLGENAVHGGETLLNSVLKDDNDQHAIDALAILVELTHTSDPNAASHYARRLNDEHPFSPQTETAKRKFPALFS